MKTELLKILTLKHFFNIVSSTENTVTYNFKNPSLILIKNIYVNWLKFLYSKTRNKRIPIYVNKSLEHLPDEKPNFGFIKGKIPAYNDQTLFTHSQQDFGPETLSVCEFNFIMPNDDVTLNFIQWQRYRKYWWSSITTMPSLFALNDVKFHDMWSYADIIAQFPSGPEPVERIKMKTNSIGNFSQLCCSMSLEHALLILLLDGVTNNSKEEYLRLHRNIAPFKISFACNSKDMSNKKNMINLATLLCHKLDSKGILAYLPNFTYSYNTQITENLHMGVTYTVILEESTLDNGILYLLNSSTMLKEEVHVADFEDYAVILFKS